MKNYIVAVASLFNGSNDLYKVLADNPTEAQAKALRAAGWDVDDELLRLGEIEDLVSDALEIK